MSSGSTSVVSSTVNSPSLLLSFPSLELPGSSELVVISATVERRMQDVFGYICSRIDDGTLTIPPHYQAERFNWAPEDFGINSADFNLDPAIFPVNLSHVISFPDDAGLVEDLPIAESPSKDQEKNNNVENAVATCKS